MSTEQRRNIAYVRRAFKRAGFPLTATVRRRARTWSYRSSVVNVMLTANWGDNGYTLRVAMRRSVTYFESCSKALEFIRRRLSIEVVAGNPWALNSPRRADLRLVSEVA